MIDIRKLKELVRLMVENDLSELDLKDQEETVTIKRGVAVAAMPVVAGSAVSMPMPIASSAGGARAAGAEEASTGSDGGGNDEAGLVAIESPMVGTYYSRPNPDAPAFVASGSSIGPESVVCLIEAMKVFNEIKAEISGTVERVLVADGEAVEFGQRLMLVRAG